MSMTATQDAAEQNAAEVAAAAYRLTTNGAITQPAPWQADLYALLSEPDRDAADLLLTPTGVGKTEAVIIAALGLRRGGAPRRLFHVRPDGATLDDPLFRIVPYLRAWVAADETPRTLCVDVTDGESDANQCRRFFPDSSEDPHIVTNPLEADVDLIVTTLSRFRAMFFGAGGVHALPSGLPVADAEHPLRRDLFFFDEAHSYQPDAFAAFHRLVEFLYAEDSDVIVASTTMPPAYQEELSFLDPIQVSDSARTDGGCCTLTFAPGEQPLADMETHLRRMDGSTSRVIACVETPEDAEFLHARLSPASSLPAFLYHPGQSAEARREIYANLRAREMSGQDYLLFTTGDALETGDLNADLLLTTLCPPENLIRRAGRCNRRCAPTPGQLHVFGSHFASSTRPLPHAADYQDALQKASGQPFEVDFWKTFI